MTSFENPTRDWLMIFTDQELMIVRKVFEMKTNLEIGYEMDLSSKSINIRVLTIFKKLGINTGLASKNKIIHFFGTRHAQHMEKIKNFEMPPPITKESKFIKQQDIIAQDSAIKIDFILKYNGYGIYDNQKIPYSREQLLSLNTKFLQKVFKRTCDEVQADEKRQRDLYEMTQPCCWLPFGIDQHNGVTYRPIQSLDRDRIFLLFPRSQHRWISCDRTE